MPSSFSPSLRIELIAPGEQAGTWGTTTNTNLGTLLESAIAGLQTVSVISGNQALTIADGAADQSRSAVLRFTTTTGAPFNVYAPPVSKQYTIVNASAFAMTIFASTIAGNTTAAGTGVTVPAGRTMTVRTDGVDFVQQNTHFISPTVAGGTIDSATITGGTIDSATITGGSLNNTPIGASTASTGAFTTLSSSSTATLNGTTIPSSVTLVSTTATQTLTNKTISAGNNTISGIAASSFVLSNGSGNIDGAAAKKAIPSGVVVGTTDTQTLTNKTLSTGTAITAGTINGTTIGASTASTGAFTNLSYTGTLTGGTGVVNFGSGQFYKAADGKVGVGTTNPVTDFQVVGDVTLGAGAGTSGRSLIRGTYSGGGNLAIFGNAGSSGGPVIGYGVNPSTSGSFTSATGVPLGRGAYEVNSSHAWYTGAAQTVAIGGAVSLTQRMVLTNDGQLQTKVSGSTNTVLDAYACRAWVNFKGTGTVEIRASGNVSSITDNGKGDYTVNFTTAMPDSIYAVVATCGSNSATGGFGLVGNNSGDTASTSAYRVRTISDASAVEDNAYVYVAIFR